MAHRLCEYINDIMRFVVNKGLIPINPCVNISDTFKKHKKKNNPRILSEELPGYYKPLQRHR